VHELFRNMPPLIFLAMVGIPLVMTVAAVALGWYSRQAALRRRVSPESPRGLAEDALGAGITVAVVPFAFALLVLWARFG
jgi:hypothetical protein